MSIESKFKVGDRVIILPMEVRTGYFNPNTRDADMRYNSAMRLLADMKQTHEIIGVLQRDFGFVYKLKDSSWTYTDEFLAYVDSNNQQYRYLLDKELYPTVKEVFMNNKKATPRGYVHIDDDLPF